MQKDIQANKQKYLRYGLIVFVGLVVFALLVFFTGKPEEKEVLYAKSSNDELITNLLAGVTVENNYIAKSEKDISDNRKAVEKLRLDLDILSEDLKVARNNNIALTTSANSTVDAQSGIIQDLKRRIEELEQSQKVEEATQPPPMPPVLTPPQTTANNDPFATSGVVAGVEDEQAEPNLVPVEQEPKEKPLPSGLVTFDLGNVYSGGKDVSDYIPAGSYAKGVIISGADTTVGTQFSGTSKPVLMRLNSEAVSAAFEGQIKQKIDVRGCLVTGNATGDLSSEKVYIRTMTLSCSLEDGKVSEYQMHGYAAGTGKAGIRGPVISREGDLVEKSFIAGLISGLGDGAQKVFEPRRTTITQGNTTTTTDKRGKDDKFKDAIGTGVGAGFKNGADRISQYLIERAEQYQPVISLQAGTPVEIVFMQGIDLSNAFASQTATTNQQENTNATQ